MNNILYCNYYTRDTPYEKMSMKLKRSLDRFGLDYVIEPLQSRESWVENCAMKSSFIQSVWQNSNRPICWVDADAFMISPPTELDDFEEDFGIVTRYGWEFFTGQILFGKSDKAGELLEQWVQYCKTYPQIWDQVSLGYAWWDLELEGSLKTRWLPERFMLVEPLERTYNPRRYLKRLRKRYFGDAVLYHYQASRVTKKKSHASEFGSADLPEWWREAIRQRKVFELTGEQRKELGQKPA